MPRLVRCFLNYRNTVTSSSGPGYGAQVPGHRQEQLMQTLIVKNVPMLNVLKFERATLHPHPALDAWDGSGLFDIGQQTTACSF